MKYLTKYNDIISRYRNGEFGRENLSLHDILERANAPELIDNMDLSEIQSLLDSSSGIAKKIFYMMRQEAQSKIATMDRLEKELEGYSIWTYRNQENRSDKALADTLKLAVKYCGEGELPKDTEAMLCPVEEGPYLGLIKIQKDCAATKFSFRHELIHYFRDVKVGNRVTTEFARKVKGKTPSEEEQEINYLTAASIMPIKEISTKLEEFEGISAYDKEKAFLSVLAEEYEQSEDAILRRLIEVRRLVDYAGNTKLHCLPT